MTHPDHACPDSPVRRITGALALVAAVQCSSLAAQPNPTPYKLSISKSGSGTGTVKSQAGGIDCGGKCGNSYSPGVPVKLQAQNGTGFFVGWSGDCQGTSPGCNLVMTSSRNVTAKFELPKLNVRKDGAARDFQIVSSKPGIDCGGSCTANFEAGGSITLEAKGGPATQFPKWPGGGTGRTHTVAMSRPFVEVIVANEPTLLAVTASGYPEFMVRETNQQCLLSPGTAGACRLALEKGRTYTLAGVGGPFTWNVNPGGAVCLRQHECRVRIDSDRQTVVTLSR